VLCVSRSVLCCVVGLVSSHRLEIDHSHSQLILSLWSCLKLSLLEFKIVSFYCFWKKRKKTLRNMTITLEDLRGGSPARCGHFNKIKEEVIRDVGENENDVENAANREDLDGIRSIPHEKEKAIPGEACGKEEEEEGGLKNYTTQEAIGVGTQQL
jgi:hypothetical protein